MKPAAIRYFEACQILAVLLSSVQIYLLVRASGLPWRGPTLGMAVVVVLTLAVSRGRQHWARWPLLLLFALGLFNVVGNFPGLEAAGPPLHLALMIAVQGLQALALALAFTRPASAWLLKRAPLAATFD